MTPFLTAVERHHALRWGLSLARWNTTDDGVSAAAVKATYLSRVSVIIVVAVWMVSVLPVATIELSAQPADSTRLIDEIHNYHGGTAVWWTGHNGWLIKSGDLLVGTDLVLEYQGRIDPSPVSALELAEDLDISFITHGHGDHFGRETTRILIKHSKCLFVIPESTLDIAHELGIPEERLIVARPREAFEVMGIRVEPIRAIHGNANFAVYYEANLLDCGYLITINGRRFFQPGDSVLLEDHLFLESVDVHFVSPTEHNTYIEPSVILINAISADYILPQHHGTMRYDERDRFWAKGYPAEVKLRLSRPLQDRFFILDPGERLDIE